MKILHKDEVRTEEKLTSEELFKRLLKNRSIADVETFIHPTSPLNLQIQDFSKTYESKIKKVCLLIEKLRDSKQTIVVYTDYDADGITGGTILWETLHLIGCTVMPYVPHRVKEGYGFSKKGIDSIKKLYDPKLIISVDHGITAKEKVTYAKELGMQVVITDHHLKPDTLPDDSLAIFHIPELSGSGVSYFFSKAIFEYFKEKKAMAPDKLERLEHNFKYDYQAIASIGTIADLVPLVGASRSLVSHGLKAFKNADRLGLRELMVQAGIHGKEITPYEVGFIIAPRINAIGRLEHAIDALRLLCTTNREQARRLTSTIQLKNVERQDLVEQAVQEAEEQMMRMVKKGLDHIIILKSNAWHEGIIGLIASRITEKYYRPTIVMTKTDGFYKGSARSIPSFHMTTFLRSHKSLLQDVGGHAQAAGFTILDTNVEAFMKKVIKSANDQITEDDLVRSIEVDMKLPISFITKSFIEQIEKLAPFGVGNPRPKFVSTIAIKTPKTMGKDNKHLKFSSDRGIEFVAFGKGNQLGTIQPEEIREIIYTPELNTWNGETKISCKVISL